MILHERGPRVNPSGSKIFPDQPPGSTNRTFLRACPAVVGWEDRFDKAVGTKLAINGQTSLYVSENKAKEILASELSRQKKEAFNDGWQEGYQEGIESMLPKDSNIHMNKEKGKYTK